VSKENRVEEGTGRKSRKEEAGKESEKENREGKNRKHRIPLQTTYPEQPHLLVPLPSDATGNTPWLPL
jgi:hypothetical protein